MRDLWRSRGRRLLRLRLVLLSVHLYCLLSSSTSDNLASLRSESTTNSEDAAPPVFCLDVGVEVAFPRHDVESAMESETFASAGTGCLRSSPMNAVMGHLKASLRTFSLHAVDCVLEPLDVASSTIALLGIASLCSRSNMEFERDMASWGRQAKQQVEGLFATEKRIFLNQNTGIARQVLLSPAYALPIRGSGLPQFKLMEALVWSDEEEGETLPVTKDQTFFTHVQLLVKNEGSRPLHVYQALMVKQTQELAENDQTVSFVLPLVMPAVVQPGESDAVLFKAITGAPVDSRTTYLMYISHSGFRSHVYKGVLDGNTFLSSEESVQTKGEDEFFDRFSFNSATSQAFLSSFPYATWQLGFMALAVMVGLAVTLYVRRKRPSARLVSHIVMSCFRSPDKNKSIQDSGGRTSAMPISTCNPSENCAKGEDQFELESLIKRPRAAEASTSNTNTLVKLLTPPRSKMPAITMQWKAPLPPSQATVSTKPLLTTPKSPKITKLVLDLDHKARLHPNRFETMWDEYTERFQRELSDIKHLDSALIVEKLQTCGISCMASGTVHGVEKFVFYAKQRNRAWFFLVTLDVTVATETSLLSLRASSEAAEELVMQVVDLFIGTIKELEGS